MAANNHIIQLSEVPVEKSTRRRVPHLAASVSAWAPQIGARKLGYSFFSVPAGKAAFPYHTHSGDEEMIYIIDGEGVLRFGKEEITVKAGSVVACPPGADYAHQLINSGRIELRYLVVSTMEYPDLSEYPDSNKVGAYSSPAVGPNVGFRALYVRDQNVNYYEGEDGKEVERIMNSVRRY
jgi:uncharacterized cupin superfamily protein